MSDRSATARDVAVRAANAEGAEAAADWDWQAMSTGPSG